MVYELGGRVGGGMAGREAVPRVITAIGSARRRGGNREGADDECGRAGAERGRGDEGTHEVSHAAGAGRNTST